MDAITNIKLSVIQDFDNYVKRLNIGYRDDYSTILDKISYIQSFYTINNTDILYEYFMNKR